MSVEWNNLPLLPIRCILDHLSVENALAAMSTCRQWRQAMLLYEGKRKTLKLKTNQLEQNLFKARLFRKHTQSLYIQVNCNEHELNRFMDFVLPQFFDAAKLKDVVFMGTKYLQHKINFPLVKLKRIILESLLIKNAPFIQRVAILGCQIDDATSENDRYVHKQVEHYSNRLTFSRVTSPEDGIISRQNVGLMTMCSLRHLVLEYESVTTEALVTLCPLKSLSQVTLNVSYRRNMSLAPVDWGRVTDAFDTAPDVAVNIISVPSTRLKHVMENVFQEGMPLASLKVMYCNTMYVPLLNHIGLLYTSTLRELAWVDCPYEGNEAQRLISCPDDEILSEVYQQVNPLILLCWQCANLQRLVIHGYWLNEYDVLGLLRLRDIKLEVSSVLSMNSRLSDCASNSALRVMLYDTPTPLKALFITDNECISWRPILWRNLPCGLRARANSAARAHYVIKETLTRLGVT